jgi:hypothetical protein
MIVPWRMGSQLAGIDSALSCAIVGHVSGALANGGAGFWDFPIFYPNKDMLCLSEPMLAPSLVLWPLCRLAGPTLAVNVWILLCFWSTALCTYGLLRSLGLGRPSSFWGGFYGAFSPAMVFHAFGHVHLLFLAGFPGILLALIAGCRSRRPFLWSALALALGCVQIVSGFYVTCLFTVWCAFTVPAAILIARGAGGSARGQLVVLSGFVLGCIAALFVLLPILIHYRAFGGSMPENPLEQTVPHSATLSGYLFPPDSSSTIHPLSSQLLGALGVSGGRGEDANSVGLAGLVAAVAGVLIAARGRLGERRAIQAERWAMLLVAGCAAAAFVLSLGPYLKPETSGARLPFAYLYAEFPAIRFFRAPARFGIVVHLCMALLGAIGLEALCRRLVGVGRRNLALVIVTVAVALAAMDAFPVGHILKIDSIDAPLTAWLRSSSDRRPFVELPTDSFEVLTQLPRHPNATVNGYSGYPVGGRVQELGFFAREFPSDEAQLLLERWGVDRVLIRDHAPASQKAAAAASPSLVVVRSEPGATLYEHRGPSLTFHEFWRKRDTLSTGSLHLVANGIPCNDRWDFTAWHYSHSAGSDPQSLRGLVASDRDSQLVFASKARGTDLTSFTRCRIMCSVKNWYALREPVALYWSSAETPDYDEVRSCKFVVPVHGDTHELVVPLGESIAWLTSKPVLNLRLDLTARIRDRLEVESISLESGPVRWALGNRETPRGAGSE